MSFWRDIWHDIDQRVIKPLPRTILMYLLAALAGGAVAVIIGLIRAGFHGVS